MVKIRWTKSLLRQLVETRISTLFKRKYSGKEIGFSDVFPLKVGNIEPFDYMIEKTLYRPRDIIAFVNECLKVAQDHYEVTGHQIKRAEVEFSRIRRRALEQEWESAFPTLSHLLSFLATKGKESWVVKDLVEDSMLQMLTIDLSGETRFDRDPVAKSAKKYVDDLSAMRMHEFVQEMLASLYRVGAIGIKFNRSDRYKYSYFDEPIVEAETISLNIA